MRTHSDSTIRGRGQRLADLKSKTAELERKLIDARVSLERELADFAGSRDAAPGPVPEVPGDDLAGADHDYDAEQLWELFASKPSHDYRSSHSDGQWHSPGGRTEVLVNHGRRSAYGPRLPRVRKAAIGAAVAAVLAAAAMMLFPRGGASWPGSVTTVQSEAATACRNPNVKSEPSQVNFACAKSTRQILWVLALLTSADNPNFADTKTGRVGLEPITPAQGGEVAWSLNLHHPYSPSNPIDSLEVAARAINNIVGGATLTSANGKQVVEPGLESHPANCARYTGSAAITARAGFPSLCAKPITTQSGEAALVAGIYRKWIVGAGHIAAHDAAVLFENATNPGNPRVQAILKQLPNSKLLA